MRTFLFYTNHAQNMLQLKQKWVRIAVAGRIHAVDTHTLIYSPDKNPIKSLF